MTSFRRIIVLIAFFTGMAPLALTAASPENLEIFTAAGTSSHFSVEMATTTAQMEQGLMYRTSLAQNGGMLFDFGRVQTVSMWMKNTLIPLDMLFIAADGRITGIAERTAPESLAIIGSPSPVRAVLEINGGTAHRLGLHIGDRVVHPLFQVANGGKSP